MGRDAYLETRVLTADPMELICLLYEHAGDAVAEARHFLKAGQIAARSQAISKAIGIIGELNASLNHSVGGTISANLAQLYGYMTARLTEANVRQDDRRLAEVESLLTTLADGWKQARTQLTAEAPVPVHAPVEAWQASGEAMAHMWNA